MRDPLREAARWLMQAGIDLEAARMLSERFPALACFHAQQSAEKALKAVLYAAGERPVLGHALAELGNEVERHAPAYADIRSAVAKLDRHYIPTRYPNGLPEGGDPSASFDAEDARKRDHGRRARACLRAHFPRGEVRVGLGGRLSGLAQRRCVPTPPLIRATGIPGADGHSEWHHHFSPCSHETETPLLPMALHFGSKEPREP